MLDTATFGISDRKPLQQRGTLRDHPWQVALIELELKPVPLRKMLWSDLNPHQQMPRVIRGVHAN